MILRQLLLARVVNGVDVVDPSRTNELHLQYGLAALSPRVMRVPGRGLSRMPLISKPTLSESGPVWQRSRRALPQSGPGWEPRLSCAPGLGYLWGKLTTLSLPSTYGGRLAVAAGIGILLLLLVLPLVCEATARGKRRNHLPHASLINPILVEQI